MKYLILLLSLFLVGCDSRWYGGDEILTNTYRAVIYADHNATDPVGYFTATQERWAYSSCAGSDVTLEFVNTSADTLSFNFHFTGRGFRIKDAIVSLPPGEIYHNKRLYLPYNAMDYWTVSVDQAGVTRVKK